MYNLGNYSTRTSWMRPGRDMAKTRQSAGWLRLFVEAGTTRALREMESSQYAHIYLALSAYREQSQSRAASVPRSVRFSLKAFFRAFRAAQTRFHRSAPSAPRSRMWSIIMLYSTSKRRARRRNARIFTFTRKCIPASRLLAAFFPPPPQRAASIPVLFSPAHARSLCSSLPRLRRGASCVNARCFDKGNARAFPLSHGRASVRDAPCNYCTRPRALALSFEMAASCVARGLMLFPQRLFFQCGLAWWYNLLPKYFIPASASVL